jgi:hypothetical protein
MVDKLNTRIQLKRDTTENWNNAKGFIPLPGEIIIYTDYETKTYTVEEYGETVTKTVDIPNIKIGTGNAYVQDLAFIDEKTKDMLLNHINNQEAHVTLADKLFWNNKLNVDDEYDISYQELYDETLVLNRD